LLRTSDNAMGTGSGNVAVGEHDALTAQGTTITGSSGQALSNVTVATFTDTDAITAANDFVATINWGDGTTSAGAVSGSNGSFAVSGTHTSTTTGTEAVTGTIADDAPGTATATAHSTVDVNATQLTGTPGDDSFTALPGNERIDAGAGADTVNFGFKLV